MAVTVRTNRATNPSVAVDATNWGAVAGTGGTAAGGRDGGEGYAGTGFYRVTWSAATTALSGGLSYTQTGLSASTLYSHQLWVRSSKAQTVALSVQYKDSASANVGSPVVGPSVALTANVWAPVKVEGVTSGAGADRAVLTAAATTGGALWASGDTFDGDLAVIETGPVAGLGFDGSFANAAGIMYAWTGAVSVSTSTATTYTPVLTLLVKRTAPTDRVEVTITDLTPTENVCTLWRTVDGKRKAVRGFQGRAVTSSDFVEDFETALGRTLTYELEVTSGVGAGGPSSTAATTITVDPADAYGWIQDPLDPASAVKLYGEVGPNGEPALRDSAIKSLEYAANISIIPILGSPDPVALLGQRLSAAGVSFAMVTEAAQHAANLRRLLLQTPLLLVRPDPAWGAALPGLCYIAPGAAKELPINEAWGGSVIEWELESPLVAAPTMNVVIPLWTYGDVAALWSTYQQAQTALSGKTYLEVRKSPNGA